MKASLKRFGMQVLGWMFILLGLAGLVLPVLQGILFLMIGLYILSRQHAWARRWMEKLERRYPAVFLRARYWLVRLGLRQPKAQEADQQQEDPEVLSRRTRMLALLLGLAMLLGLVTVGQVSYGKLRAFWQELQKHYKVVEVAEESRGYRVELRRTWGLRNRRYVVRCHICEPVQVGGSYRFEPIPGRRPPMMKRLAGPGEIPDFYTVVEGVVEP
jgi:hypothetical protein